MLTETVIRRDLNFLATGWRTNSINNCRSLLLLKVITDMLVQQNVPEPRTGRAASGFEHLYVAYCWAVDS